jgi:DNA-binding CsgD family transcriptional regulator/tetratricopeptide (TPR) repeat protein
VQPLPGPLRLPPSSPFVGRSAELATLRALVPHEAGERGRLALVAGEAGAGKSRLVRELAHEAAAKGVLVLYGACDAVVQTPFRPFAQALDQLARSSAPEVLRADLGSAGGELTRLVPDLPTRVEGLAAPIVADPDTERHRLHTAVTDILAAAGSRQPLLLVLEDGHWADTPTLVLLRHLARASGEARVLVVVTFRDTEADIPAALAEALADLRRLDDVVRLGLDGLSEDDVGEFVRRAGGGEIDSAEPELARAIRELTEGNAFLLCELWRALVETDALALEEGALRLTRPLRELATPQSVREVVSQRLARLDPATRDLLELAAVAGPEFELDVLRRAAPVELERIDALEPAMRGGVIEELPFPALAYRFTHELVRRALYDRLSVLRRAELHLRIAEALEALDRPPGARVLAGLAHHFAAAAPIGGAARAVEYNLLAAKAASAALAYDDATARLRTALEMGVQDERRRAETLLDLGTALFRAGRSLDSLHAFREAAEIARDLGEGELLTRAAIGFETSCWRPGLANEGARELLEESSAALAREDSRLRVGLLASLARALEFEGDSDRAAVVRANAIAMARRIDDWPGLATVLRGIYWARATTSLAEALEMLGEARDLAGALGDVEGQAEATQWRVPALMALGEIATANEELAVAHDMARHTRQPFILHVAEHYRSALALLEGRLDEAEASAERSREWGRLLAGRDASGVYGIQMFGIRREQGRLAELAPVMRVLAAGDRGGGAWRPGLAAMLAELAMEDQVRSELDRVAVEGLDQLREGLWIASLTYLADAASAVSHDGVAALVYPELVPLAGTNVMIGHGVACYGAADRYLGMLAATLGEDESASRHFEAALLLNRRMGASTWLAHTAYEYGRILLARGEQDRGERDRGKRDRGGQDRGERDRGGQDRGEQLLAEATLIAEAVGMPTLLARARALAPASDSPLPDGLTTRELDVLRLMARGRSNREIGAALFISEHTAANHVRSILRKTASANRTEATAYAYRHGLADEA